MKKQGFTSARSQGGFTMTELLIVVVIIGILGFVAMRALSGSTDNAHAIAIRSTASELAKGVGYIHANLGNGLNPTNPIATSGMLSVLVDGESAVVSTYKQQYVRLGMRPLSSDIKKINNKYYMYNYELSLESCTGVWAGRKVCSVFTNVSMPVAEAIADKEGLTLSEASSKTRLQDTVHIVEANGVYTVTFALVP